MLTAMVKKMYEKENAMHSWSHEYRFHKEFSRVFFYCVPFLEKKVSRYIWRIVK